MPACHRRRVVKWRLTLQKNLRASQQQRIRRQQAPDGTPYAARKRQPVRSAAGAALPV
ncbi:phage virion morphogenesis protein [Salmonella enterica subsp. enterica serovar Agona]|nr:phage virion morphogenesis protein [Salmonella enterica]MDY2528247.1 phage virion morphogenesis protein [Salmonella enterica subsp. enterica serovar Agona]